MIPKFIRLGLRGEPVPIYGEGYQSRDFTHVDNVVEANLQAAEANVETAAVNIGGGRRHTLLDLVRLLQRELGRPLDVRYEPPRPGDVRDTEADITLARRVIGYSPRVDFETGLSRTIASLRRAEEEAQVIDA